ncbi:methyl-CpG-binding domain protein 2-like [Sinocyclocheilus anshuiensis]|uniref:methyl-CpG-binding domain protein 2-like n=1 Tax=Sinocyclocheilus anshuiensis TaxID=1608454 RepID=UPI0007B850AE|nr:PREDICTED: methyl-CpG-binding domain protein 2-like [Sinocyclocheilus anshuiensis]
MIMERKKADCPALPPGWKKEEVIRKSGMSAGKSDVYYYSPTGKKFRSKPQLSRYLGNSVDLGCFDFRTGKMMPSKMQKNKQRLRSDNLSLSKGKPDLNTALPIRQTASIFKQPVTKVVNHPNNKVKTDLQRATEQPRQVPPSLRVCSFLKDVSWDGVPLTNINLFHIRREEKPGLIDRPGQSLHPALLLFLLREQELKVHQARRSLEEALMADGLARAAESRRDTQGRAA